MVIRIGGGRRKTRYVFRKEPRNRGKFSITAYMQKFKEGDQVMLDAESSIHGGMYHRRFHARTGIIAGKQGKCYIIKINDFGKPKNIIVHPIHLKKLELSK